MFQVCLPEGTWVCAGFHTLTWLMSHFMSVIQMKDDKVQNISFWFFPPLLCCVLRVHLWLSFQKDCHILYRLSHYHTTLAHNWDRSSSSSFFLITLQMSRRRIIFSFNENEINGLKRNCLRFLLLFFFFGYKKGIFLAHLVGNFWFHGYLLLHKNDLAALVPGPVNPPHPLSLFLLILSCCYRHGSVFLILYLWMVINCFYSRFPG